MIFLIAVVAHSHAHVRATKHMVSAQGFLQDQLDSFVNNLGDKLFDWGLNASSGKRADLETVTSGKVAHSVVPATRSSGSSAGHHSLFFASRFSLPSPLHPLARHQKRQQFVQAVKHRPSTYSDFLFGEFGRLWLGQTQIPVVAYRPSDFVALFGGALFLVLKKFQEEFGDVFLLPTGPASSFLVVSEPESVRHVLTSYKNYRKDLIRELSYFLFGDGFAVADGDLWKVRRKAVAPSLHKKFLDFMVQKVFAKFALRTNKVLAAKGEVDMEVVFSELALDIICKAVFNFDVQAVETEGENPIREAVYTAFKEVEDRSIDFAPVWKLPGELPTKISPRQKRAADAVALIRHTTEDLIEKCRLKLEAEEVAGSTSQFNEEDYLSESDPSVLRFIVASREEVKSSQLRDDLLSMLVAGHDTTACVMTWTLYLLVTNPDKMARVQEEIDSKFGASIRPEDLTADSVLSINYLRWCIFEAIRLYPQPPVLIRRAIRDDVLPNGWQVPKGQDIMVSIYNLHHSASVWSDPDEFQPERWSAYKTPRDNPTEINQGFRYIPFGAGERRCIGNQFALLEANTIMVVMLRSFDFQLVEGQDISMKSGGTIHTSNGMKMRCIPRTAKSTAALNEKLPASRVVVGV